MRDLRDTICARATPPGEGAIAIVRISGGEVRRLLSEVFCPAHPPLRPRVLSYGWVRDNEEDFDEVMANLKMRVPRVTRNNNRDYVAVGNGIFDYSTKKMMPFSPEHKGLQGVFRLLPV